MNVYNVPEIPNELLHLKRSFSDKLVYQSGCDFEFRANSEAGVTVLISLGFEQRHRLNFKN